MTTLDDIAETLKDMKLAQDHFMREISTIKRGIYGDEENMVKGLIEIDREQHDRIRSLEQSKNKVYWFGSGFVLSWPLIYEFVKKNLGL